MADTLTPLTVKTKTDGDVNVDINVGPTGASALQGQGTAADGVAPNANPNLIGGFDGTLTQTIKTDAAGELQVDVLTIPVAPANDGVDIGDVDVTSVIPLTGATNLGKAQDSPVGATDTGVAMLAVRDDALSAITPAADDYAVLRVDANGALWTRDDILEAVVAGSELQVDVVAPLPAGTNAIGKLSPNTGVDIGDVDVLSGPTGASAFEVQGTAADGAAAVGNPVLVAGEESGGNAQSLLVDSLGHLQIDVLTGGGAETPTNPSTEDVTSAALASGAQVDLDSTDVGATTQKLTQLDISASVPIKAIVMTVADAVETIHTVLFVPANGNITFRPPHRNYITQGAAGAGFDGFRVDVKNMDNVEAGDVYCTYYLEE